MDGLTENQLHLLEIKYGITKENIASGQAPKLPEITAESIQEITDYYLEKIRKKRDEDK